MHRYYKTEGIIVKRRNFGEADRILTVLTKNYGKIQVKAPGVRKITSRRSSHIELLNLARFTLYRSFRVTLPIVTEAQTQEEFLTIKNNLKKIGLAYYICELIDRFCAQNQENRTVFFLVRDTLFRLADLKVGPVWESFSRHSGNSERSVEASRISIDERDSGQARMTKSGGELSIIEDFEDELLIALGFLSKSHQLKDRAAFIENILERKLTTKRLLPLFIS